MQAHVAVEERDLGRPAGRLLERELGVRVRPVLVVALRRQVDIKAANRNTASSEKIIYTAQSRQHSLFVLDRTRPS